MEHGDREEREKRQEETTPDDEASTLEEDSWLDDEEDHLYDDWDDLASDPEEASRLSRAIEGILPDIVRRGVGGLVSDDGIRALVKDRELPREAVGFILGQADATKREVVRMVSKEVRMFLENVDLGGELTKILTSISFEIRTEVRFIPNDAAVKPNVRNRVRVRGRNTDEEAPDESEADIAGAPEDEIDGDEKREDQAPRRRRWSLRSRGNNDEVDEEETKDD